VLQDAAVAPAPEAVVQRERDVKRLTDRLQSLMVALPLQRLLASEEQRQREAKCAEATGEKMKNYGFREVRVRFLGGVEVRLLVRYYARNKPRAEKGKGVYFGLLLLGIHDHCSPALASEVAKLAAAMNSLEDARLQLAEMGITLTGKQIAAIAYAFSARARMRQRAANSMGIAASLAGKRVVVSTDGGRVRIRTDKRGRRTKKGRRRYRTDWREPKLLAIYVVDEDGKIQREFTPVLDGTLKGPEAVFRLIESYLSELQVDEATKVLFIADGAKWIWNRVAALWKRLGLKAGQCMELVDFYHVVEHVGVLAGLKKKWSTKQKRAWITRQVNRLKKGKVDQFIEEIKKFTRGKRGKDWRRERGYLLRNAEAGRLNYARAREHHLPNGSGIIESTVRRVLNLRMKGASIFWTKDNAEDMLFLRSYYKAGHWKVLEYKALEYCPNLAA